MAVFRLKRLKERLWDLPGSWGDSLPAEGGTGRGGASCDGNGYDKSRIDLLVNGIVFLLSENPKNESCGDDGWLKLLPLRLQGALPSPCSWEPFGSSTAAEFLRLLVSFRRIARFVAKMSPTIPQYATRACSNWAEDWRKAVLIPYAVGSSEQCSRSVLDARIRAGRYDVRRDGGGVRVCASNRVVRTV